MPGANARVHRDAVFVAKIVERVSKHLPRGAHRDGDMETLEDIRYCVGKIQFSTQWDALWVAWFEIDHPTVKKKML